MVLISPVEEILYWWHCNTVEHSLPHWLLIGDFSLRHQTTISHYIKLIMWLLLTRLCSIYACLSYRVHWFSLSEHLWFFSCLCIIFWQCDALQSLSIYLSISLDLWYFIATIKICITCNLHWAIGIKCDAFLTFHLNTRLVSLLLFIDFSLMTFQII